MEVAGSLNFLSVTAIDLAGVRVHLGQPRQVTESHGYAYIPTIAQFPSGELIITYSLVPDTNENPVDVSGLQISTDGGMSWGQRHEIIPEHQPLIYIPAEDGSLSGLPGHLYPAAPGDNYNFQGTSFRLEQGGRRMVFEPQGVRIVDWPWPVESTPRPVAQGNWFVKLCFDGSAIRLGNRLLATAYGTRPGESLDSCFLLASEDGGSTWRYHATVADPSMMTNPAKWGANGPCEPAMVQLADGDLLAVFRIGNGPGWYLHKCYSSDGGATWSQPEALPAYSVEPSLLRLQNGTLALSTGRPGIFLWLSTDSRGQNWQAVDLVAHHNRCFDDLTYKISPYPFWNPREMNSWTYTEMVEVAPNKLLLVYDRVIPDRGIVAYGPGTDRLRWAPSREDVERFRIFVLPIEIERI